MAKSFKKFRDEYEEDEWGTSDSEVRSKEKLLQNRRDKKKKKVAEKFAAIEDTDNMNE
jgi:hypothetical protein